jgi:outer membrane lipoprotein-sorting protein
MSNNERNLSQYIDSLNEEKKPKEHGLLDITPEMEDLFEAVRQVRSLKEPALPGEDYPKKLAQNVAAQLKQKSPVKKVKRNWFAGAAAVAAVLVAAIILNFVTPFNKGNIVYAIEQAYQGIKAYHGVLEIAATNEMGQTSLQGKLEIWADKLGHYYVKELEGTQQGLITANNGQKKWQLRPEQKEANVYSAFPDPYRFTFELGKEVDEVKNALKSEVVGEEVISGRKAAVLEVYPQGGVPYRLWIDNETKLPLQKQSGMQNALQYTAAYTQIDFDEAIPTELMTYNLPAGFKEINTQRWQIVSNIIEAQQIVGFAPKVPKIVPSGYSNDNITVELEKKTVKLNYISKDREENIVILEAKANKDFKPASTAGLGKIGSNTAEVQLPIQESLGILGGAGPYAGTTDLKSIRWQHEGLEYAVIGNASLDEMIGFVNSMKVGDIQIPAAGTGTQEKPQVEVPVNIEVEENDQKSVDAGHSPWKLDPAFLAQVFVSLKISPEDIQGDYPIKYEELKITQNTGIDAIVEVNSVKTPISKVYLKKLIRQDNTGIWTVVGYDPADEK